jgi:hypothetical protein
VFPLPPTGGIPSPSPSPSPMTSPTPIPAIVVSAPGLFVDSNSPSDPNFGQATLPFGALGVTTTLTLTPSYATFTITLDPATCGSGSSAVVTITPVTATTYAVKSNAAGICKATITSPSAITTTLWFTVNQTGLNVS